MSMLSIFGAGVVVLVGALVLNIIASYLGLLSWYDFLQKPGSAQLFSYLWLFLVYPLSLGFLAYLGVTFFDLKVK